MPTVPQPEPIAGFTLDVDGDPRGVQRILTAATGEMNRVLEESVVSYPTETHYVYARVPSVRGTLTVRKAPKPEPPAPRLSPDDEARRHAVLSELGALKSWDYGGAREHDLISELRSLERRARA